MQEHSCGFVLFRPVDENRYYLLLHYKAGHWDFPKGHVEAGENEEQTARRELEEETGIRRIEILPGFRYEYVYEFGGANSSRSKKVVFMLAHTDQYRVRLSHEHKGSRWVPYERALKMLTFPNARAMLMAAEEHVRKKSEKEGSP
ncbi:MAG: bis(5'-nucleosyl)-tetraphosphatase [Candidatus Micrarchaeota archaeon]